MNEMDASPCKSIYIEDHGKYRRYSGLLEKTPKVKSKRFKIDKVVDEGLNLAFVEDAEGFERELTSKTEIVGISTNIKNNLNIIDDRNKPLKQSPFQRKIRGRPRKVKNEIGAERSHKEVNANSKIGPSPKATRDRTSSNAARSKINFNNAFVEEKEETSKNKSGERERKQRRLSGLYKPDLNRGFIEESSLYDEEMFLAKEEIPFMHVFDEEGNIQFEAANITKENSSEFDEPDRQNNNNVTPVKSKLRRKPKKKDTEEEIIKLYTDKTVKKKQTSLETIFETPKPEPMTVKKYRRFINFNERMSSIKVKKRCCKIVKYNLWQNTDPITMDYFVRKMEEIEEDF